MVSRVLRWMLLLVLLGAAAYVVVAVEVKGRTILDRILGAEQANQVGRKDDKRPDRTGSPDAGASDLLTEEDRNNLDLLIDEKLEKEGKGTSPDSP